MIMPVRKLSILAVTASILLPLMATSASAGGVLADLSRSLPQPGVAKQMDQPHMLIRPSDYGFHNAPLQEAPVKILRLNKGMPIVLEPIEIVTSVKEIPE